MQVSHQISLSVAPADYEEAAIFVRVIFIPEDVLKYAWNRIQTSTHSCRTERQKNPGVSDATTGEVTAASATSSTASVRVIVELTW